jgi:hypothetical protein
VGMIQDVPEKATSKVRASTSSGSVLPQEKLKLAFNLVKVSSRILRVFEYIDRVVHTDLLLLFLDRNYWGRRVARPRTIQS